MANAHPARSTTSSGHEEVNLEIDDTQNLKQLGDETPHPPILVLSRDAGLVETVKKAAPRGTPVTTAPDLDHVAEKLSNLKPGVLVADTASTADIAGMVAQLTQHFPELVVVVAGKREDSVALMQLTAAGRIFRFLLTPLSHGQTRLALEAAVTQHLDLTAAGNRLSSATSSDGSGKNYVVTYGALGLGLVVIIGGIWFGVSRMTREPATPNVQHAATTAEQGIPEKPDPVKAELALAKDAFDQGKYLEPVGESALDLYRSALSIDPNSEDAKAGIRSVVDKILEKAEAALVGERLEEAIRNIETARDIDATHPRLAFLDTQVARERERLKLSQAQEVGTKVRALVAQATDRMQSGRLITPAGNSARDALVDARKLDPTDPNVLQGIRDLGNALGDEARKSLTAGKNEDAQQYLAAARQLGAAGSNLAAVERALAEATRAATAPRKAQQAGPSADDLVATVRQRISEGKLIDPAGESARDALNALRAAAANRPEVEELSRALTTRLLAVGKQAMDAKAFDRSAQLIAGARDVGARYNEAAIAQAEHDLTLAREQQNVVSASTLKRTRMVAPVYPSGALKKGIEGWVEVSFNVTQTGQVEDVQVRNSSPAEVFDDAAIRAVRQWRFEPVARNGVIVEQKAITRLRFSPAQAQ